MSKRVDLYGILEEDEELFQDVIDGNLSYTLAKSFIYGWMKEACRQAIELAAENAKLNCPDRYGRTTTSIFYSDEGNVTVDSASIINTINQVS